MAMKPKCSLLDSIGGSHGGFGLTLQTPSDLLGSGSPSATNGSSSDASAIARPEQQWAVRPFAPSPPRMIGQGERSLAAADDVTPARDWLLRSSAVGVWLLCVSSSHFSCFASCLSSTTPFICVGAVKVRHERLAQRHQGTDEGVAAAGHVLVLDLSSVALGVVCSARSDSAAPLLGKARSRFENARVSRAALRSVSSQICRSPW